MSDELRLRPLEREDLRFVHELDNNETVMHYWFEEPYEAFVELCDLYDKHIHDQSERRFIAEQGQERVGLVELVEINHIHRRAEFQIIIAPAHQGKGYATQATRLAMDYAFMVLNLYKLFLIVDCENERAVNVYSKLGFKEEGRLRHEFFVDGEYRDVLRMAMFQPVRNFSVTGVSGTAPTTASRIWPTSISSCISAEPAITLQTFLAGQPMLMSMIWAPRSML